MNASTPKVGDRIVVTSPHSAFLGMRGTVIRFDPRSEEGGLVPFPYYCQIDGYNPADGLPTPFGEHEIRPSLRD